jgi:hypothetical protein
MVTPSLLALALLALPAAPQEAAGPVSPEVRALVDELENQGVQLDPGHGLVSIAATVEVRDDLLEYLLVGPAGASHESVFQTQVLPSVLNVAMLSLGVEPGSNASWQPKDPPISEEELRDGVSPYDVTPPAGDGFYMYAGWRDGGEVYFYRMEDLLRNLMTGRAMQRHRWVYLGSRMVSEPDRGADVFAADVYHNIVNVSFFSEGYTLLTGALPQCLEQTIWMANGWLVPARGSPVRLVFSLEPLERAPEGLVELLPEVGPQPRGR